MTDAVGNHADDPLSAWCRSIAKAGGSSVRLVLADVDGVVTPGEGFPADLAVLARLAELNRAARIDPRVPAITLCTGRPAPYVEALAQAIDCFVPALFEHGAGMFHPRLFRYDFHPALHSEFSARMAAFRAAVAGTLLRPGRAFVQPGKEATMSLYPSGGASLADVGEAAAAAAQQFEDLSVELSLRCVEVRPRGIDKGTGVRWLASSLGVPLRAFAGVGDADPDLSFLSLVGYAAAPANATPAVRAAVVDVADAQFGQGLLEIVDRIVAANQAA